MKDLYWFFIFLLCLFTYWIGRKSKIMFRNYIYLKVFKYFLRSVQFSHLVMSNSLWPHGRQHARLPCPSPSPAACSNLCPLSWWCHPTNSSCCPLLLPPSILPSIRVFSNELLLHMRWPKHWSFSFKHQSFQWTLRTDLL